MSETTVVEGLEGKKEGTSVLGWRVLLSKNVLDACVTVPKGVEGQTVGSRVRDLRAFLEYYLKQAPDQGHGRVNAGFMFTMKVVNDNRKRSDFGDGLEVPGTAVPLTVFASIDNDGAPALVVLHDDGDVPA